MHICFRKIKYNYLIFSTNFVMFKSSKLRRVYTYYEGFLYFNTFNTVITPIVKGDASNLGIKFCKTV